MNENHRRNGTLVRSETDIRNAALLVVGSLLPDWSLKEWLFVEQMICHDMATFGTDDDLWRVYHWEGWPCCRLNQDSSPHNGHQYRSWSMERLSGEWLNVEQLIPTMHAIPLMIFSGCA